MSKSASIVRQDTQIVIDRGGGARTTKLATAAQGASSLLNGITEFDPGASIPLHWHNCEESVLVLEGEAQFEIDGARHHLVAGDLTIVAAQAPHRFVNPSADQKLRIFWTYASLDATRTLAETGVVRRVDEEGGGRNAS